MHVGQVVPVLGGLKIEARTAAGAAVPQFAPFLEVDDPAIAALGPTGLVGRRPGRTRLMIRALSLDSGTAAGRGVATVSITVIP